MVRRTAAGGNQLLLIGETKERVDFGGDMAPHGYKSGSTPRHLMGLTPHTLVRITVVGKSELGPLIPRSNVGVKGGYTPCVHPLPLVKGSWFVDTETGMVLRRLGPNTPAYQVTIESMISQRV